MKKTFNKNEAKMSIENRSISNYNKSYDEIVKDVTEKFSLGEIKYAIKNKNIAEKELKDCLWSIWAPTTTFGSGFISLGLCAVFENPEVPIILMSASMLAGLGTSYFAISNPIHKKPYLEKNLENAKIKLVNIKRSSKLFQDLKAYQNLILALKSQNRSLKGYEDVLSVIGRVMFESVLSTSPRPANS